ncbi:MAG: cyclase family protein [Bacteroidales bacterium]|nr:cyclase family protein [Bacteroidales bacterium]MBN2764532.1 cyclase family protein [Bacteroidales bacterium]
MNKAKIIDLSHTIAHGMNTYQGIPAPVIRDFLSREESKKNYEEGTEFHIGIIEIASNTGTSIDVPFHRYPEGADLSEMALGTLTGLDGILVEAPVNSTIAIDESFFEDLNIEGKAVLIYTGWDIYWQTEQYRQGHPFLTEAAAKMLAGKKARLVGIDTFNIDDTRVRIRPVQSTLLMAGIPIIEHLCNLSLLPAEGFRFYCVPPKIKGLGSFPVRAFAEIYG